MTQTVFMRVEKKYLITTEQYRRLARCLSDVMKPDSYDAYTISNVYYDTDDFVLARASIEKPVYKEKLRVRSYGRTEADSAVFVELKRKFGGVVYKRRASMPYNEAIGFLSGCGGGQGDEQILNEIRYFTGIYDLGPKAFISYNRRALSGIEDDSLRITFDSDILFRQSELRLDAGVWGTEILPSDTILMEIKAPDAMPLWLGRTLSELDIFPASFSKYGSCYKEHILGDRTSETEVAASA